MVFLHFVFLHFLYIVDMKKILYLVLVFALYCFAQTSSDSAPKSSSSAADSQISCPDINRQGMQKTKNIPTSPDKDKWKKNKINIIGIVDSVGVDSFFVEGKYLVYYVGTQSSVGKIVKIKNINLTGSDNDMKLAFDSNAVFVPLDLNLVKGDSIFITNYSATFFLECYTHTNLHGEFIGSFSVNTHQTTKLLYKPQKTSTNTPKKHNRNATGRRINKAPSKMVRY